MDAATRKQLADEERRQLLAQEREQRERAERQAVRAGVAEVIDLGKVRGEAFLVPGPRKARAEPVRRLTGLEWLTRKGKITAEQASLGLDYGECYREAQAAPRLKSCLAEPSGGQPPTPAALAARARRRHLRVERLDRYRAALGRQPDLVSALDLVCGEEKTPREAAKNGQGAGIVEALVVAALGVIQADLETERRSAA